MGGPGSSGLFGQGPWGILFVLHSDQIYLPDEARFLTVSIRQRTQRRGQNWIQCNLPSLTKVRFFQQKTEPQIKIFVSGHDNPVYRYVAVSYPEFKLF
ncbi:MAG: hypothetical protein ACI9J5_003534 [Paraglaciecola sp.]|jgi:hypothetical protein